ncbi:MAG: TatD family hydrolase [Candidatus Aenigmatarchaeota archaeon]
MLEEQLKLFKYFDIHCHAYEYSEKEIENFLNQKILIFSVSENLETSLKNIEIYKKFNLPIFVGIHPWNAHLAKKEDLKEIEKLVEYAIGIGEIGLDKIFFSKTIEKQKEIFVEQIKVAKEYDLPVNLHSANSIKEVLDIVFKFDIKKANFHWVQYSSYLEEIKNVGYFCSFNITLKFKENHRKALEILDLKNILTESDGPYEYKNVKMNSKDVIEVVKEIANFYKVSEKKVINQIKKNLNKFI